MRSSKSRSRSKTNRPRTLGNIINRVFDSSGPEGKVRGTPQQIIEKYLFLARDAQLSNDRVAAENFLQHAEHYTRMLGEANRELAAEQESRQQFQPQGGQQPGGQQQGGANAGQNGNQNGQRERDGQRQDNRSDTRQDSRPEQRSENRGENRGDRDRNDQRRDDRPSDRPSERQPERQSDRQPDRAEPRGDFRPDFSSHRSADARDEAGHRTEPDDVIDLSGDRDQGLVDLPEAAEHRPARSPAPRKPSPAPVVRDEPAAPAAEAVERPAEPGPKTRTSSTRRPRVKKPAEAADATGETPGPTPREAAE